MSNQPRNVAMELDKCRMDLRDARNAKTLAYQAWKLSEAKQRMHLRAIDDAKGQRWADADVAAALTVMRNDPEHEIGKAWLKLVELRATVERLEADHDVLNRANWDAIQRGKFGV